MYHQICTAEPKSGLEMRIACHTAENLLLATSTPLASAIVHVVEGL